MAVSIDERIVSESLMASLRFEAAIVLIIAVAAKMIMPHSKIPG
jgi:hypothetical protein